MQETKMMPYNLQFFAEGEEVTTTEPDNAGEDAESIEALKQQLADERAAKAKDKAALDKALKQVGDLTKQLRSRQTQQEIDEDGDVGDSHVGVLVAVCCLQIDTRSIVTQQVVDQRCHVRNVTFTVAVDVTVNKV